MEVDVMNIKLDRDAFGMPERKHEEDAGIDLYSKEYSYILPHDSKVIGTGTHIQLPKGTCGLLVSRSGLNINHCLTSTGLIDEGFTGEIKVRLYNNGKEPYTVHRGDRITQLLILPVVKPKELKRVKKLDESERGDEGYGSTGR